MDEHARSQGGTASVVASMVSELVSGFDLLELLDRLLWASALGVGARGAAVLVPDGGGGLQVLAATSETARDLELFQVMAGQGPAYDCLATGRPVLAPALADVVGRWPAFAPAARALGMDGVASVHMGVHGTSVGALNLFDPAVRTVGELAPAQALADVAVLALLHAGRRLDPEDVVARVRQALDRRVVVEQAKGVVAEWTGLSPAEAGPVLLDHARRTSQPLGEVARRVVHLEVGPEDVVPRV